MLQKQTLLTGTSPSTGAGADRTPAFPAFPAPSRTALSQTALSQAYDWDEDAPALEGVLVESTLDRAVRYFQEEGKKNPPELRVGRF